MERSTMWIIHKLQENNNNNLVVYGFFEEFKKEFNYTGSLSSFKRRVRRLRDSAINKVYPNFCKKPGELEDVPFGMSCDASGDKMVLQGKVDRVVTVDEILDHFSIDKDEWAIDRVKTNVWDIGRKEKEVDLVYTNGKAEGFVRDTGKIYAKQLFQITVWLVKKKHVVEFKDLIVDIMKSAKDEAPLYKSFEKTRKQSKLVYELCLFDPHFGLRSWAPEAGEDYNLKIASQNFTEAIDMLLYRVGGVNISKIVIPIGNDFFNVDNQFGTTSRGTQQDEDSSFQKSFTAGFKLLQMNLDKLLVKAPVSVIIVGGNHDSERCFYLGHSLECWYNNCKEITIDNSPFPRKYFGFGKTLLGYCHQHDVKESNLPLIMAVEAKEKWANAVYREWRIGHKHTKKRVDFITSEEYTSIRIRRIAALTARSAWTTRLGLKALREAEGFLWDYNEGNVARFSWKPKVT